MQPIPIGQVLLRFQSAADADAIRDQVSAITLDADGNLWLGATPLDGIRRLTPTPINDQKAGAKPSRSKTQPRPTWGDESAVNLAEMFDLPDPGEPTDLAGMARSADRLWFIGSHAGARVSPNPALSDADNLRRLTWVEPIPRRACLGSARIKADRLPEPQDLSLLPIEDGGNVLTRALAADPHLGPYFAPGPIPLAENGLGLAGLACRVGRLWIGLSAPVLGGFAVVLEVEPREASPCVLGLKQIGPGGRPYRKHLVDLKGRGVQDLRWKGDTLLILSGSGAASTADPAAGQPGIYQLREATRLGDDSLTLADDPRLALLQPLVVCADGDVPQAMELYDGFGQSGVLIAYSSPSYARRVGSDGVLADVFPLTGV